jgi:PKD repeat protein
MPRTCRGWVPVLTMSVMFATACHNDSQEPRSRAEPPIHEPSESEMLAPIDLIYVCGNKFLATNSTDRPTEVSYRVAGTEDTGTLSLAARSGEDDGGRSETELTTRERGVVELYQNDQRLTRRQNGNMPCGPSPSTAFSVAGVTSADAGSWTAPSSWPVVALHLSLLPDGKVLAFGHEGQPQLWNPSTGAFTEVSLGTELFCAGHTLLADGRLLVAGGHISDNHGLPDINVFSPGSQTWARSGTMQRGRWYPTTTMLSNGDVLIMAGADEAGLHVPVPEIWSSGSIRRLTTASLERPYYPRLFLVPNGEIFYVGELKTTRYLNTTGTGTWRYGSDRLYGSREYGAAVMYDAGKILYVGGGRTTNTAETIDLTSSAPAWRWTGSMTYPRRHLNATVLPTGEVLVTGGSSGTGFNDVALGVHPAEIWNPRTGTWTVLAGNTINRTYHATSLLLPDGRVLHAGSGDAFGTPPERNAELFSPPYLFRGARPTIGSAPTSIPYSSTFQVTTPEAAEISKVSLIRLGSTTHAFDMGQRFQSLLFQRGTGALTITGPTNPNVTPPGHYMLFVLNADSVPSVAKIIRVGGSSTEPPPNSAPAAAFSQACTGLSCGFTDGSTDADGSLTAWTWAFGDGTTSTTRNPTHSFSAGGSYQVTLTVTDNDLASASTTKTVTVSAPIANSAPTAAFTQTCSGLSCTFTDGSTDADGTVTGWSWDFGDNTSAIARNPAHTYTTDGTYTVGLVATDDDGATGTISKAVTVSAPGANTAPTAAFTVSCLALSCKFTNGSTDVDGSVIAWKWTFGNGTNATTANPSRSYTAGGTYNVTLEVTDNGGAVNQVTKPITITSAVKLTATGRVDATRQYITVNWSGANGTMVDLYRNRTPSLTLREPNDGLYTYSRTLPGLNKYTFWVCESGSSTMCSNEASVVF